MLEKNQEQQHDLETMVKICERAEAMGIEDNDRITLGRIDAGNIDAEAADEIIQCAVFGDVIFG